METKQEKFKAETFHIGEECFAFDHRGLTWCKVISKVENEEGFYYEVEALMNREKATTWPKEVRWFITGDDDDDDSKTHNEKFVVYSHQIARDEEDLVKRFQEYMAISYREMVTAYNKKASNFNQNPDNDDIPFIHNYKKAKKIKKVETKDVVRNRWDDE